MEIAGNYYFLELPKADFVLILYFLNIILIQSLN